MEVKLHKTRWSRTTVLNLTNKTHNIEMRDGKAFIDEFKECQLLKNAILIILS